MLLGEVEIAVDGLEKSLLVRGKPSVDLFQEVEDMIALDVAADPLKVLDEQSLLPQDILFIGEEKIARLQFFVERHGPQHLQRPEPYEIGVDAVENIGGIEGVLPPPLLSLKGPGPRIPRALSRLP